MSGYVLLEQIEAVDDVLQRWHKEVDFLQAVAQAKKIPFFYRQETRIRPTDGMMVHFCLQFDSLRCIDSARHLYKTDGFFLRSESVFGNFSFYSYKKACGQKKTVRGSKNSRRLSNGTPAI